MATKEKGYLIAWPIFGASNQLLASLILLAISVWLIKSGKNPLYTIIPMLFMMIMTVWSLVNFVIPLFRSLPNVIQGKIAANVLTSGICGVVLLGLTFILVFETAKVLVLKRK